MKRLDDRTVELTDLELAASNRMEDLLDRGLATPDAVEKVRSYYGDELSDEFYAYIGELRSMGGRYWQSWPTGHGRRAGVSVPLHWVLLFYLFFWWLILFVLLVRVTWYVTAYTIRYLRRKYRDASLYRSRR